MVHRVGRLDLGVRLDPRTVAFRKARAGKLFASPQGVDKRAKQGPPRGVASTEGGLEPQRTTERVVSRAFQRSHWRMRSTRVRASHQDMVGEHKVDRSAPHPWIVRPPRPARQKTLHDPVVWGQAAPAMSMRWGSNGRCKRMAPTWLEASAGRAQPPASTAAKECATALRRVGFGARTPYR